MSLSLFPTHLHTVGLRQSVTAELCGPVQSFCSQRGLALFLDLLAETSTGFHPGVIVRAAFRYNHTTHEHRDVRWTGRLNNLTDLLQVEALNSARMKRRSVSQSQTEASCYWFAACPVVSRRLHLLRKNLQKRKNQEKVLHASYAQCCFWKL